MARVPDKKTNETKILNGFGNAEIVNYINKKKGVYM